MVKGSFERYFKEQIKVAGLNYGIASQTIEKEALHNLRVAIKKIRLCARLADRIKSTHKSLRSYKKNIRPLFKICGKIRISQMQIDLLEEFETKKTVDTDLLKEFILKRQNRFRKKLIKISKRPGMDVFKDYGNKTVVKIMNADESQTKEIVDGYRSRIYKKLVKNNMNLHIKGLHRQRKLFKEFRFCSEILTHGKSRDLPDEILNQISRAEDILGNLHDLYDFKRVINKFRFSEGKKNRGLHHSAQKFKEEISVRIGNYREEYLEMFKMYEITYDEKFMFEWFD